MIRAFGALALGLAFSPLHSETTQERAKRIIDEALAALGGEKYLQMRDRVESGRAYSFYREQLSGLAIARIYTRYLTRPQPPVYGFLAVRERQSFGKKEDNAIIFFDNKGYEITFRGARPLPDAALDRFKESTLRNVFYILRERLSEPGLAFEWRGTEVLENQPVETVEIIDSQNNSVAVYFNSSTKLPVRQRFYRRDPTTKERIEEVTDFSKYRDVSGIQWPFTIHRERNGEKIYEIFSESVSINQDLPDSLFVLPANMRILKPAR